jgi:uncharacterized protein
MNEEYKEEDQHQPAVEEQKLFAVIQPVTAAFIALIGIFLTYQIGGAILTLLIFGFNFEKADINALRLLTTGGQILLMLLPTLLFARFVYPTAITWMLRVKYPNIKEIGIFLVGFIILLPLLQNLLTVQNFLIKKAAENFSFVKAITNMLDQLDKMVRETYGDLLKSHSIFETSLIVVVVAVVPAICEEFLFRGFVQKSFEQKYTPLFSIFITSLFFGLYHFNPYDLLALIALGFYFGFAAYMSNSIFVSMSLHFANNFFAVVAFIALGSDELLSKSSGPQDSIPSALISSAILLLIFAGFIFYVKKNYSNFTTKEVMAE